MNRDKIVRARFMPLKLPPFRLINYRKIFGWRANQAAIKEQRNKVSANCFCRLDNLIHCDGFRIMRYASTQLLPGYRMNAVAKGFLKADDAAGDMPAGAIMRIIAPSQQDAIHFILDQQINIDQRGNLADIKKQILRQPLGWIAGHEL